MKRAIIALSLMALSLCSCERETLSIDTHVSTTDPGCSIKMDAKGNLEGVDVDLAINYVGQFDSAFVSLNNKRTAIISSFPYHTDTTFSVLEGTHIYEYGGDIFVDNLIKHCYGTLTITYE